MADSKVDVARLCAAVQRARLVLRRPREERVRMVRQFVGQHWSEEGSSQTVPVNLLGLYVNVVGRKLIAADPRVMLSTDDRTLKPVVSAMESWTNKQITKMNLAETLERAVLDALFSVGVCKVALATPADAANLGWGLRAGEPYAEAVDLDDFVYDIHARKFSEVGFVGHRYRVPLSAVRDSKLYSKDRKNLSASEDRIYNQEGDERVSVIGRTTLGGSDTQEFEDMVDLWEVYLPRHRLVVTLAEDSLEGALYGSEKDPNFGRALRVQKWLGPDCGPYHFLGFGRVPGNAMPKAPAQDLIDLHEAINRMVRKLIRQADRQKDVVFVQGGASEDGTRLIETNDGEATRVDNPEKLKQVMFGGPNQANFQLFSAFRDLFSWLAGNLDIMGGLSPQSKTATQDELLNANSSASLTSMQQATTTLACSVLRSLCWYWHHDPVNVQKSRYNVPGVPDLAIRRSVYPAGKGPPGALTRSHTFEDMEIDIDPYSMQHATPEKRLRGLNEIVTQIIIPLGPMLQQNGVAFDVNAYLDKVKKYMNLPDLADIVSLQEPPPEAEAPGGGDGASGPKPAETTRNYVRHSQGAASQTGKELGAGNLMPSPNGQQQPQ